MIQARTQFSKAVTTAAFLAAVWLVAAAVRPTSTYHLAPLLVAGSIPAIAAVRSWAGLANATTLGAALAVGVSLAIGVFDLLRGPTLLPYGGALAESLTFAVVGALGGAVIAALTSVTKNKPTA
jgi:hypothetical protein